MYGCESWTIKKSKHQRIGAFELWCWRRLFFCFLFVFFFEKTLESPLDCKEIQPVHSEGDQPWDFFGRTDAEAKTPILWPSDMKN